MSIVLDGDNLATVGVLNSASSQASTSGTSINFTLPTGYVAKRITIVFAGVSTSGTSNYLIQVGTGGSATTTGYLSTGGYIQSSTANATQSSTSGIIMANAAAAAITHGQFDLALLGSNTWVGSYSMAQTTSALVMFGGGQVTLGGTLNYVRITTVNGTDTFDAGSINILYE